MITLSEIKNITFRKGTLSSGYRSEDVDAFIDEVTSLVEALEEQNKGYQKEIKQMSQKVEECRQKEENIGAALMNAQRQADSIIREANHKAEIILNDATLKSESIISNTQAEVKSQQLAIQKMQHEISSFKNRLMDIYKEHLTLISALPSEPAADKEKPQQKEKAAAPAVPAKVSSAPAPEKKKDTVPPAVAKPAVAAVPEKPKESVPSPEKKPAVTPGKTEIIPDKKPEMQPSKDTIDVEPLSKTEKEDSGFSVDVSSFVKEEKKGTFDFDDDEDIDFEKRPSKFKELAFGEEYNQVSENEGSPIGIFKKKNK